MVFKILLGGVPALVAGAGTAGNLASQSATVSDQQQWQSGRRRRKSLAFWVLSLSAALCGCRTVPASLPRVDLKQPGWTVHEGQAVWTLEHKSREIAGDVLVATRKDGEGFVQFSKSPFPLVIAQASTNRWQVEFPPQNKHYAGRGKPPKRLIWLYLPRVLEGRLPPQGWTWRQDSNGWRLENHATSEALEGYFTQ